MFSRNLDKTGGVVARRNELEMLLSTARVDERRKIKLSIPFEIAVHDGEEDL